jgi:hypothetical protein
VVERCVRLRPGMRALHKSVGTDEEGGEKLAERKEGDKELG